MEIDLFVPDVARRRAGALFDQLRDAVVSGRLAPGDRLATTRDLAADLGVARSTVATVYARLVAEGYAVGRVGDGTFVAATAVAVGGQRRSPSPSPSGVNTAVRAAEHVDVVADLRTGRPDPRRFPVVPWRRSVLGALQVPPPGYGEPAGLPELRRVIASWVGRSRGVMCEADQVVITAGAQQAFDLIARGVLRRGDAIAVEDPGYAPARRAFEGGGLRVVPVPVDTEGMVVDAIPACVRAVYVTPSHQAPSGAVLSAARRRALLARAGRERLVVVEDDYDTEFRYVDRPLEPLHRLDASGAVHYVGSFSKTLSPSLRLGFVVAPPATVAALTEARATADLQPPALTQAALADFIARGDFERHLRRSRRAYRPRRDLVVAQLLAWRDAGLVAGFQPCPAGLHATAVLADATSAARAVALRLGQQGVVLDTTDDHHVRDHPPGLIIGFGLADPAQLGAAFPLIERALAG